MDKKFFNTSSLVFYSGIVLCLFLLHGLQARTKLPELSVSAQVKHFNLTSEFLKIFHLGQKRLISSYLWVETMLKSDTEHYDREEGNSWLYHRFNNIITLDPWFYEVYLYGGQYLAIIKDEPKSAEILLDKGVEKFPENFRLRYFKAYNSLFELNDKEEAFDHYGKLIRHPKASTAPLLFSIYANLSQERGLLENEKEALQQLYKNATSEAMKKELEKRLKEVEQKLKKKAPPN